MAQTDLVAQQGPSHLGGRGGTAKWGHSTGLLPTGGAACTSPRPRPMALARELLPTGVVVPQVAVSATTYLWVQGCPSLPSAQGVLGWLHKLQGGESGLRLEITLERGK